MIRTAILACLLFMLGTIAAHAKAEGPFYIHGTEVNLREEPWGEIIHIFDVNEKIFVVKTEGQWSYVSAPVLELKGWVWNEYIGDGRLKLDENQQQAGDATPPVPVVQAKLSSAGVQDTVITSAEPLAVADGITPASESPAVVKDAVAGGSDKSASGFIPDEDPASGFEAHVPPPGVQITSGPEINIDSSAMQKPVPAPAPTPAPAQLTPSPGEQDSGLLITQEQRFRPAADLPSTTDMKSGFYQPYEKKQHVAPDQLRGVAFLPVGGYDIGLASGTRVNVREEPTTDGKILGKVNKRDKLFLIHEEDGWYFVSIPDQELKGWVSKEFILELPRVEITGDNVRLREDPNMKARIKKEVDSGSVFYQFDTKHDWIEVADSVSGLRGWVHEDYIKPTQLKPSRPYKVKGDAVNFRTSPSLDGSVITSFDSGTDVQVLGRTTDWTYAKQGQQYGWIFSELLQPAAWGSEGTLKISDPKKAPSLPSREYAKASSPVGRQLIERAIAMAGVPYVWGGSSDSGVDCSGLIYKILCSDMKCGTSGMPRRASEQFAELGYAVDYDDLEPGDLVFFTTYKAGASHVGIYLGEGDFIHASSVQHQVGYSNMEDGYYKRNFVGGRRLSEAQLKALQD
ncbi:SH3 domain-containing protein [bacterium]|nr:SH3 domain-containing protein [bacterium]